MAEYIEREKAYEKCGWYNTVNGKSICAARKDELAAIPAADVAPVRHGRWISLTECANEGVYCSVCNKKVYKADYAWSNKRIKVRSNYCPNCGAKMEADHEDD